ncbi:MAG: DUF418 domain-containing protein [Rikenellaceae bacterium]|nr:DUF418 domain-containing protein [Rikenellaceae bacterium]
MNPSVSLPSDRLSVVDALRGFALLAIVLLHNLEHYNIYFAPEGLPEWLQQLDGTVWRTTFFLLAGKAYATFSLLFGFSFYVQMRNARGRGVDFRARFAWRMLLLAGFSQLHALFYNGDILLLYAVMGLVLIPASGWKNRTVFIVATVLMLQPLEWGKVIYAMLNPDYRDPVTAFGRYAEQAYMVGTQGNFIQTLRDNIWNGQLFNSLWQIGAGRLFQTPALFLYGMLLGRLDLFKRSERSVKVWRKLLVAGVVMFIPLYLLQTYVPAHIANPVVAAHYGVAVPMLVNFAFMTVLVSFFVLCWFHKGDGYKFQRAVIPYGRMSLTNYITQSVMGVCLYYNFGLGLYRSTGATQTLLIGLGIFAVQLIFSRLWLARHKQGPLEYLWKRGTWIGSKQ